MYPPAMDITTAPCPVPSPRYGGPFSTPLGQPLPSKAELILSRYRPIAPKPASFPSVPIQDSDHALSSMTNPVAAATIDNAAAAPANVHICCRQVPELGKNKRARKRKAPASSSLASPRYPKKGALTMPSEKAAALSLHERREAAGDACSLLESTRMMQQQDAGFMARAAASSPPCVLPERKMNCRGSLAPTNCRGSAAGGFSEMIRSITGLSTVSDVRSLMHHPKPLEAAMAKPSAELGIISTLGSPFGAENPAQSQGLSTSCTREELIPGDINKLEDNLADFHPVEEDGSCPKLVTLALLPDTPSRSDYSTAESSISTCSSLAHGNMPSNTRSDDACHGPSSPSSLPSPCDIAGIERMYDKSPEPVVLVDDTTGSVIWLNKAYQKALKDALERKSTAPFIDPLGTPTVLHKFQLLLDGSSRSPSSGKLSPATLWGFLKKLVIDMEGGEGIPSVLSSADSMSLFSSTCIRNKHLHYPSPQCGDVCKNVVIVPQPKRLIGSRVSLESITDVSSHDFGVLDSLDLLKRQLEEGVSPAIITDSNYLVKWVNSAYKQMVGQPECPWLASTMGDSCTSHCQQSPRLAGEVLIVRSVDIPSSVFAFSGMANIQWSCRGGRTSMTVPCDVSRLQCTSTGLLVLLWKLDIQASLSLACSATGGEVK